MENYETAEGVSLPRSTLYNHYMRHCNEHKLDAVNAASFGKLIRSVFTGLRTRRLGTRGNSKYHYYGIRLKPGSNLVANDEKPQPILNSGQNAAPSHATSTHSGRPRKNNSKPETYEACSQVRYYFEEMKDDYDEYSHIHSFWAMAAARYQTFHPSTSSKIFPTT